MRPTWRLPTGVPRGVWDYVQDTRLAEQEDAYFAEHPLFAFDAPFVLSTLAHHGAQPRQWVADLGCGAGRMALALAREGYRSLAIELSAEMLAVVRRKAQAESLSVACVRANLVELDGIADASVHHAVSLFSTLGMIRGRRHRQAALRHAARIVRPGGLAIFHVHNWWFNLYDPGDPRWLLSNLWKSLWNRDIERGDRYYPYRGIANMFLHVFTRGEILSDLRQAGFSMVECLPLNAQLSGPLARPHWFSSLRCSGWMIVGRR